jgi:hypothetical protein
LGRGDNTAHEIAALAAVNADAEWVKVQKYRQAALHLALFPFSLRRVPAPQGSERTLGVVLYRRAANWPGPQEPSRQRCRGAAVFPFVFVYAVVDDSLSPTSPLGVLAADVDLERVG